MPTIPAGSFRGQRSQPAKDRPHEFTNRTCRVPLVRFLTVDTLLISAHAVQPGPAASKSNELPLSAPSLNDLRFDNSR
jgi:hypothetical protein